MSDLKDDKNSKKFDKLQNEVSFAYSERKSLANLNNKTNVSSILNESRRNEIENNLNTLSVIDEIERFDQNIDSENTIRLINESTIVSEREIKIAEIGNELRQIKEKIQGIQEVNNNQINQPRTDNYKKTFWIVTTIFALAIVFSVIINYFYNKNHNDSAGKIKFTSCQAKDKNGFPEVHNQIGENNPEYLKDYVKNNCEINIVNSDNLYNGMHYCAEFCHKEICKILIDAQIDLNKISRNGKNFANVAGGSNCKDVLELAKEHNIPLDLVDKNNRTAYIDSLNYDDLIASTYLSQNTNVNIKITDRESTYLMILAQTNEYKAMKNLLKLNSESINYQDIYHNTALHVFTINNPENLEIIKLLVNYGINIDAVDKNNRTALVKAIEFHHDKVAENLLQLGANPNVLDQWHKNSVFYVCLYYRFEIADLLINHYKVDLNIVSEGKSYPLHLCTVSSSSRCNVKVLDMMLKQNAKVDVLDGNNRTGLILAAQDNCIEAIKLFLKAAKVQGVDIKPIKDNFGKTAYDYAKDKPDILKLLQEDTENLMFFKS